jgi:hypothetical protein
MLSPHTVVLHAEHRSNFWHLSPLQCNLLLQTCAGALPGALRPPEARVLQHGHICLKLPLSCTSKVSACSPAAGTSARTCSGSVSISLLI